MASAWKHTLAIPRATASSPAAEAGLTGNKPQFITLVFVDDVHHLLQVEFGHNDNLLVQGKRELEDLYNASDCSDFSRKIPDILEELQTSSKVTHCDTAARHPASLWGSQVPSGNASA